MAGLIIIFFILLKQAAESYRTRNEQQISAQYNHYNSRKKQRQSRYGIHGGYSYIIRSGKQGKPQQAKQDIALRRLFSYILAAHQRDG